MDALATRIEPIRRGLCRIPPDVPGIVLIVVLTYPLYVDRLRGMVHLSRTDIVNQFFPNYVFLGERLRAGDLPGWNPYTNSGIPFLGDPVSGWGYLPAMTLFTVLPPTTALQANFIFHVLLAGLGTYALARITGLNPWGATVAGVATEYGAIVAQLRSVNARAQLMAWVPIALLGLEIALNAKTTRGRAAGWSLGAVAVSQMVVGWTGQGSAYGLLTVGAYAGLRALLSFSLGRERASSSLLRRALRHLGRHAVDGGAVIVFGLGLAAAGLWIRLEVNRESLISGGDYSRATGGGGDVTYMSPQRFVFAVFDEPRYYYVGGATAGLAILALFVTQRDHWRVVLYGLYALLIADLMVTPGIVRRFPYLLPKFQDLHEHSITKGLVLLGLPAAMLAGITADALVRWRGRWLLLGGLALLPIFAALSADQWLREAGLRLDPQANEALVGSGIVVLAFAILGAVSGPMGHAASRAFQTALVAMLLLTIVWDPIGRNFDRPVGSSARVLAPAKAFETYLARTDPGGAGEFLQRRQVEEGPFRFLGYGPAILNAEGSRGNRTYHGRFRDEHVIDLLFSRTARLGLYSVQGYNPAQSARYFDFLAAVNGRRQNYHDANVLPGGVQSPLLRLLNLRYVIIPREYPPEYDEVTWLEETYPVVFEGGTVKVVEITDALPHAWVVHRVTQTDREDALAAIQADGFDPATQAVIEGQVPSLGVPPAPGAERVDVTHYEADRITFSAVLTAPGLVVVSEMYSRGWNAYVDGDPAPLVPTNFVLRGIPVPPGRHEIELRYEPAAIRRGIAVTLGTALALGVLLLQPWRWRRFGTVRPFHPMPPRPGIRSLVTNRRQTVGDASEPGTDPSRSPPARR